MNNDLIVGVRRDRSSFSPPTMHTKDVTAKTLVPIVNENIAKEATVMTDDAATYYKKLEGFAGHETVNHSAEEYVRYEALKPVVHTNRIIAH